MTDDILRKQTMFCQKMRAQRETIIHGHFSEVNTTGFDDFDYNQLEILREAYYLLEPELVSKCVLDNSSVIQIIPCLREWSEILHYSSLINEELLKIPEKRLFNPAKSYLEDFYHKGVVEYDDKQTLHEYIVNESANENTLKFVKYCEYSYIKITKELYENITKKNDRSYKVLKMRAQGKTLEEVGQYFGLTRERIRQIELKSLRISRLWLREHGIVAKIIADLGGRLTAYSDYIEEMFGEYGDVVCYILIKFDDEIDEYYYDKSLDLFIFGDNNEDVTDQARHYCESFPDHFDNSAYNVFIRKAVDELNIPEGVISDVINEKFDHEKGFYNRRGLKLADIYKSILEKYYPNGLWVYGEDELEEFKNYIREEFGEVQLSSNHAIVSGITRIGVLCGRGIYRARKEKYLPDYLIKKIEDYIDNSPRDIILFNTIFLEFEEELQAEGIDNRYYFQGISREVFGEKYYFRKDYLSKSNEPGSVYKELIKYVHQSKYPVTAKEITAAFPGVTQIVVNLAMQDSSILKFYWSYMYAGNLNIYEGDRLFLSTILDEVLSDGKPHHDSEIFTVMDNNRHDILARLGILYPYNLYSVIEYLFGDYYNFARPYIARRGVDINHPLEAIDEFVKNTEVFDVSELIEVAKQYHYHIPNVLEFINSYNETHVLLDHDNMATFEYIGVSDTVYDSVEQLIDNAEIVDTVPISSLGDIGKYPKINVSWNEWILYSVINKWSKKYDVGVAGSNYRNYIPIISLHGKLDKTMIDPSYQGKFIVPSDLDNIDELLIDVIDESDLLDI